MTLNDALASMTDTMNATKRGAMGGYVWRFTNNEPEWKDAPKNGLSKIQGDDLAAGHYYISLVKRDGSQYIYKYGVKKPSESRERFIYLGSPAAVADEALNNSGELFNGEDDTSSPGTGVTLDGHLLLHIGVGYDWAISTQVELEASRHGSNKW